MKAVLLPREMNELWAMLADNPGAALMAGGTDLLVRLRNGLGRFDTAICLERLPELQTIHVERGMLCIGACVTHRACLDSPLVREHAPILVRALAHLGGPQIRNMATLGGNICTASPAGDGLTPLYVLGAEVVLRSRDTERRLPIADFIHGPGRIALRAAEILTEICVPLAEGFQVQHFEKVGRRNALAIAVVSLAALVRTGPRGIVQEARLALGSVGPTVVRPIEAEKALVGRKLSPSALTQAARLIREAVSPIDDIRATADYRRQVAGNLLLRLG
ncbi:xanthine dehydrogenase FAD-binding subunit [Desulfonatronum thiosulfatophilum]|uniref:Xanthine dehydrogenase FAD-binding subunit n=1 Tax=Desulfonatronum thiosulfatophilum TaxID=617002 RepID=A0A1G6ATA6_9BACT|nr:xanthine dehydrogenase family protein subunit M [Desulfonatronum thiosulfatophilum]SDB11635.1 xanthine dehydrogenase FAD-binding subunit [Desulfonatronum thiosulfatophilum]